MEILQEVPCGVTVPALAKDVTQKTQTRKDAKVKLVEKDEDAKVNGKKDAQKKLELEKTKTQKLR